ncbi:MAG: NAD(P) transhydrogenase subunit alpha [Micromonosporaceae bacterium]
MRVAVVRETRPDERRVALAPAAVSKLTGAGLDVAVEPGAGESAQYPDEAYRKAGAEVSDQALDGAHALLGVQPPTPEQLTRLAEGAVALSFLPLAEETALVRAARDAGVALFAMELVPRISRAQSMDALSSQALVSGYRAGLVAAERFEGFFPLLMTAAGTVPPAKVLVLGAGVAGLQAIATTKRLGAVVSAYDVRAAAAEEIRSLGAKSIALDLPTLEGAGGYAREMAEDRARKQQELLSPYIAESDVLITTAAVPGRAAPRLVTADMLAGMRTGSVAVDLAAESGGNIEGSVAGKEITVGGVALWGAKNVPSQLPRVASTLYANNITNLLLLMTSDGQIAPDLDDEVIAGCCVTYDGQVRNDAARALLNES